MSYSRQQAEAALQEVERAERRAGTLRGYERGAPHFILWGLVWMVGYGLSAVMPGRAQLVWLVLTASGLLGSTLIRRAVPGPGTPAASGRRHLAVAASLFVFMLATYFVMAPKSGAQFGAFPPLMAALFYVLNGIWRGPRWIVAGIAVGVLTIGGFAFLREHFMLWMAVVGGSALILTGLWLRRA